MQATTYSQKGQWLNPSGRLSAENIKCDQKRRLNQNPKETPERYCTDSSTHGRMKAMNNSDGSFFSKFAIEPEFESIFAYEEFGDYDLNDDSDLSQDEIAYDDLDDFFEDDIY
jgi:hypothetical protein